MSETSGRAIMAQLQEAEPTETHLHASWMMPLDIEYSREMLRDRYLPAALLALREAMKSRNVSAVKHPPIPPDGLVDSFVHEGAYRVLVQFDPFPIVGVENEPDEDGNPVYIYGDPCWQGRVDVIAS